jgi:MFS-type transporter involved in bile tolerance (Atg22 family)
VPFSRDEFLGVFEAYNQAVWPAQVGLYVAAVIALVLAARTRGAASKGALAMLAALWLWMGVAYHFAFFTAINPAAWVFGATFVAQASLFGLAALREPDHATPSPAWSRTLGATLLAYALLVYPLLGRFSDHSYPRSPTFGLPCPTTIFTFGLLLWLPGPAPGWLLVIPLLWAVVGSSAPFSFGIWEDLGLPVAAAIGVVGVLVRAGSRHARASHRATTPASASA